MVVHICLFYGNYLRIEIELFNNNVRCYTEKKKNNKANVRIQSVIKPNKNSSNAMRMRLC